MHSTCCLPYCYLAYTNYLLYYCTNISYSYTTFPHTSPSLSLGTLSYLLPPVAVCSLHCITSTRGHQPLYGLSLSLPLIALHSTALIAHSPHHAAYTSARYPTCSHPSLFVLCTVLNLPGATSPSMDSHSLSPTHCSIALHFTALDCLLQSIVGQP